MNFAYKSGTKGKTESVLSGMSEETMTEVSAVLQILANAESLEEAKSLLLDEMDINGKSFSIVVKRNFQFVIAGVFGEDEKGTLIIEVKSYE